ncbi:MAG: hypothetical protein OHK0015_46870 [Chloroflexi bacterium OHK40]
MNRKLALPAVLLTYLFALALVIAAGARADEHGPRLFLPLLSEPGAAPMGAGSSGGPIAVSPGGDLVWVVNPDAGSISAVDARRNALAATISVGGEPWALALTPDGRTVLVLDRAGGQLVAVDAARRVVRARLQLGAEPGQVLAHQAGDWAYVTLRSADALAIIDLNTLSVLRRVALPPHPYALALAGDGARLYVTHQQAQPTRPGGMAEDDGAVGLVSVLDTAGEVLGQIQLPPDAHGFANQLAGIAIYAGRAWVPHIRAAPELPNQLSSIVFAAVASLDLAAGADDPAARLSLNDEEVFGSPVNNPVAAVPSPDGRLLYIVLAGSDLVEVVDVASPSAPRLVGFIPAGRNPRGIALSPDGRRGYVMSYLSRAMTVLDLEHRTLVTEILVAAESWDAATLQGAIRFHTAADPRMSRAGWISCASCHADGGTDGVTWLLTDGPRQTPPLWNAGETLPWHWSAALDEPQDIEGSIHTLQFGLGLAPGSDPPLLGAPNVGRSADLDALAAFLRRGFTAPAVPEPPGGVARGRTLFVDLGCATCHSGPNWTRSALPGAAGTLDPDANGMVDVVLTDVGTLNEADIRGASGFDVPSLLGVGRTAPYMHDGSLSTLVAVLSSGHPQPGRPAVPLPADDLAALAAFLQSIDSLTPALPS